MLKYNVCSFVFLLLIVSVAYSNSSKNRTLRLVHVLLNFGEKTPEDSSQIFPKDPNKNVTYYPFGKNHLTNNGRRREYTVGKQLRGLYASFLGDIYIPARLFAWSSSKDYIKETLEAVLASLFPPKNKTVWNKDLNWQPIAFYYGRKDYDYIMQSYNCPNYVPYLKKYLVSKKPIAKNQKTYAYLSEYTGKSPFGINDAFALYHLFRDQKNWNVKLPKWTEKVYPNELADLAVQTFRAATDTVQLRRIAAGYFLRRALQNMEQKIKGKSQTRIYVYSGEGFNIVGLLRVLGLYDDTLPVYGTYIILELHKVGDRYKIRILQRKHTSGKLKVLKMKGCDTYCPLAEFKDIVKNELPTKDNECGFK